VRRAIDVGEFDQTLRDIRGIGALLVRGVTILVIRRVPEGRFAASCTPQPSSKPPLQSALG